MSNAYPQDQDQPCAPPEPYTATTGDYGPPATLKITATLDETESPDYTDPSVNVALWRVAPGAAAILMGAMTVQSQVPASGTAGQTECVLTLTYTLQQADTAQVVPLCALVPVATFPNGQKSLADHVAPAQFQVVAPGTVVAPLVWSGDCGQGQGT